VETTLDGWIDVSHLRWKSRTGIVASLNGDKLCPICAQLAILIRLDASPDGAVMQCGKGHRFCSASLPTGNRNYFF
jgi:hypothetical protein